MAAAAAAAEKKLRFQTLLLSVTGMVFSFSSRSTACSTMWQLLRYSSLKE